MAPDIERIAALAQQGKSAREISAVLGCSRNAVLGRVHRAGLKLGELNGWVEKLRAPRPPKPPRRQVYRSPKERSARHVAIGLMTRERILAQGGAPGRGGGYPLAFKVQAVAAVLMGKSHKKVADAMGFSFQCFRGDRGWLGNPAILAQARPIAEAVKAKIKVDKAAWLRARSAERLARRALVAAHNAPILAALPPRQRDICTRYLTGASLAQVGEVYGVSRERIRQLMGPAMRAGLDTSETGRNHPVRAVPKTKPPTGRPRGRPPWTDEQRQVASERMKQWHVEGRAPVRGRKLGDGASSRPSRTVDAVPGTTP